MSRCNHSFSADLLSLKTTSYAAMHLIVAITVAYALTLDWRKALAIGIVEPFVQTFAFALHDRFWRRRAAATDNKPVVARSTVIEPVGARR